jgi:hypothetical protein
MRVACLVAASRQHPWHKAQGRPSAGNFGASPCSERDARASDEHNHLLEKLGKISKQKNRVQSVSALHRIASL